jgi:hypothetical protein
MGYLHCPLWIYRDFGLLPQSRYEVALARAETELGQRKLIEEALNVANQKLSQRVERLSTFSRNFESKPFAIV